MENKKTTELMSRKSTLKSKLMAAVSMLLVSAIMVSVTTYAWFILSTAPEVKGMSTTVGSNGALEMALVDYAKGEGDSLDAILNKITTNVGDSSAAANKKVEESNRTWGNLVDLSGKYYGLSDGKMMLYPSALNMDASNNNKIGDMNAMLKYAAYGTDGRVAELKGDTFATKYDSGTTGTFQGYDGYGVRAIGTGDKADPIAAGLAAAKRNYNNAVAAVKSNAEDSLNNHGQKMAAMAVRSKMLENETYTEAEVQIIRDAKTALVSSADQIKLAIQEAYNAYMLSTTGKAAAGEDIDKIKTALTGVDKMKSVLALIDKYNALIDTLNKISVPTAPTGGKYTWPEIQSSINALMDSATLKINGKDLSSSDDLRAAAKAFLDNKATPEQEKMIEDLMNAPAITVAKGAYCEVANFVGAYTSVKFDMQIRGNILKASNATITIAVSNTTAGATPYFTAATTEVTNLTAPGGEKLEKDVLTTAYGYVVDLAFRTNASNAKLMLAKPDTQRVDGATDLQGGGATFTVTNGADAAKLADALRVVFIDTADKTILGVAAMNKTPTETGGNTYALHMYNYEITTDGTVNLKGQKMTTPAAGETAMADDTIVSLTGDAPKAISALVYIDGGAVAYAMDKVTGSLNLQFCTDAELHPMVYKNYATTPLKIADDAVNTVAKGDSVDLPKVTLNGSAIASVTWTADPADKVTIANGKVTGLSAGDVTITATYTDNSGTHTGSYKLTVTTQGG